MPTPNARAHAKTCRDIHTPTSNSVANTTSLPWRLVSLVSLLDSTYATTTLYLLNSTWPTVLISLLLYNLPTRPTALLLWPHLVVLHSPNNIAVVYNDNYRSKSLHNPSKRLAKSHYTVVSGTLLQSNTPNWSIETLVPRLSWAIPASNRQN